MSSTLKPLFRFVDRDMLMRFHFGLAVGHAYSHSEFHTIPSIISEVDDESNTPSESVMSRPVQDLVSNPSNPDSDGGAALSDVESEDDSEDASENSIDLGSDEHSEGDFHDDRLDWDEELVAEEMYEE